MKRLIIGLCFLVVSVTLGLVEVVYLIMWFPNCDSFLIKNYDNIGMTLYFIGILFVILGIIDCRKDEKISKNCNNSN